MISFNNVNKRFKDIEIYKNVSYSFKENKITCFYGPSGSGKTTLLNMIAGFDESYEGEVVVDGTILKNLSSEELCQYRFNNIGFVFQEYNLFNGYTAIENVLMGINLNSEISEEEKKEKSIKLLTSFGLKDKINQRIDNLSGGEKQRVAIARALVNDPKIILADEPTGALDEASKIVIMDILKEISKEKTVIVITHDEEIEAYGDEVIEVSDFKLVRKKSLKEEEKNISEKVENEKEVRKLLGGENKKTPKLKGNVVSRLSIKNFKIHIFKYIIASLIIALGISAFVSTMSFKNITNNVIDDFKEDNFYYNIGQIALKEGGEEKEILKKLSDEGKIKDIYYQYLLEDLKISYNKNEVEVMKKAPSIMKDESIAYGTMPKRGENEIALPENIAKRLNKNIKELLGSEVYFEYKDKNGGLIKEKLKVVGITNAKTQDFILSEDFEEKLYNNSKVVGEKPLFARFNIAVFEDVENVEKVLRDNGLEVFTRSTDIEVFQNSFNSLVKLYTVVSYFVLIVALLIAIVILLKISKEREKELFVLSALGYTKGSIKSILIRESMVFTLLSTMISFILIKVLDKIYSMKFLYDLGLNSISFIIITVLNIILCVGLSYIINIRNRKYNR